MPKSDAFQLTSDMKQFKHYLENLSEADFKDYITGITDSCAKHSDNDPSLHAASSSWNPIKYFALFGWTTYRQGKADFSRIKKNPAKMGRFVSILKIVIGKRRVRSKFNSTFRNHKPGQPIHWKGPKQTPENSLTSTVIKSIGFSFTLLIMVYVVSGRATSLYLVITGVLFAMVLVTAIAIYGFLAARLGNPTIKNL